MENAEFVAKLREFQVSLDMYIRRFEAFEQKFSELSHTRVAFETRIASYEQSLREIHTAIENLAIELNKHKEEFFKLYVDFSKHTVQTVELTEEIGTLQSNNHAMDERIVDCEHQLGNLINRIELLQKSLDSFSSSLAKLDTTVTKNDLLIGKLNFTIKAIIGLISGIVAVIGTAVACWDYLAKFFAK